MAIPVATTTITILRVPADPTRDPMDPKPAAAEVATGVRAHISTASGREDTDSGASQSVADFRLGCDPVAAGLKNTDQIRDEQTGEVYEVTWSKLRLGFGLDHWTAGLQQVKGVL